MMGTFKEKEIWSTDNKYGAAATGCQYCLAILKNVGKKKSFKNLKKEKEQVRLHHINVVKSIVQYSSFSLVTHLYTNTTYLRLELNIEQLQKHLHISSVVDYLLLYSHWSINALPQQCKAIILMIS